MEKVPGEAVERAWVRLMQAQRAALSKVEADLKASGFPPIAWYDVLLALDRAGEDGMRPFELERQLLVAQYSLSRLLDRVERAGYVERRPCDEDGRGQIVAITEEGRDLRRRMWPVYGQAMHCAIGARLSTRQAETLAELLAKLVPE